MTGTARNLVTGGAGFIGSHLVDHLLARGEHVVVLDDFSTGSRDNLRHLTGHPRLALIHGSITDPATVAAAVEGTQRVFHLAAAVGVRLILDQPVEALRVNLHGTDTVLAAAKAHECRFLFASSSEIYGRNTAMPLSEDADRVLGSPLRSRWSYAAAKGLDELLVAEATREGLAATIARPFNVVGERQKGRYGMVLPSFVRRAVTGDPLPVHGDGSQRRCFCSVHDVVPALARLIDTTAAYGRAVNLGSTSELSILDLARRVIDVTESDSNIEFIPYDEAYPPGYEDMARRVPDTTLARELLDFRPEVPLDATIRALAAQYGGALDDTRARTPA